MIRFVFECGAPLPEVCDNDLTTDAQYFAFCGGFCGARCAAENLAKHGDCHLFTREFMSRIAAAIPAPTKARAIEQTIRSAPRSLRDVIKARGAS